MLLNSAMPELVYLWCHCIYAHALTCGSIRDKLHLSLTQACAETSVFALKLTQEPVAINAQFGSHGKWEGLLTQHFAASAIFAAPIPMLLVGLGALKKTRPQRSLKNLNSLPRSAQSSMAEPLCGIYRQPWDHGGVSK